MDGSDDPAPTAFVPGHITAFFSPQPDPDPLVAGSRGAGIALSHGVSVSISPATDPTVILNGEPTSIEPVMSVLRSLNVSAEVHAKTPLPLGAGFGVSGAIALGTALVANAHFDCGRSVNELTAIAHRAEVKAGTGLGDVVAQARGGVPIRLEPGAPGSGELDGVPASPRIEYCTFGELSTESVLSGETEAVTTAGERALSALVATPTIEQLMHGARTFSTDAGLLGTEVKQAIEAVEEAGGQAAMAMLGRTIFAIGTGLSDAGYDPAVCRCYPAGAHLVGDADTLR
ncbi:pantoate kinase [Halalkalirubrum salinum]|uniref:pantoate kinase n=1 Tax=Halalkalirubrum salinum TaxID=2563889 RepID=UPI0010FB427A|nr:pantoate kinase [Halalkalirubrum salinum]